jgi:tetratricopeptide (TPR) repeat protein
LSICRYILILTMGLQAIASQAEHRYSQLVMSFNSERPYQSSYSAKDLSLVLEIQNTTPQELDSLNYYDESVIRRVLVKELGSQTVEIRIVLRDKNIRASVTDYREPFRIVVEFFDQGFQQQHNPVTGLPEITPHVSATGTGGKESNEHQQANEAVEMPATELASELPERPSSQLTAADPRSPSKFRLLQPAPEILGDPGEIEEAAKKVEAGLGKAWKEFPIYVYRIETAGFEGEPTRQAWLKEQSKKGLTPAQAAADFAGKQFDFGHEGRALAAYQQALHQEPSIFAKDVLHLWKMAEIQLGQGNLTLADGYYQSLIEKHPDSNLSGFAQVRRLDLSAIRALRLGKDSELPQIAIKLQNISSKASPELTTLVALRQSFWNHPAESAQNAQFGKPIPRIHPASLRSLKISLPKAESSRTAFIASSLLLHEMIESIPEWNDELGDFAGNYFRQYFGAATEPYRTVLKDELKVKLERAIEKQGADGRFSLAIKNFEALPEALKSVQKTPTTAWALAESYRAMGKLESAARQYEIAATSTDPLLRLKASFWQASTFGSLELDSEKTQRGSENVQRFARKKSEADDAMRQTWGKMRPEEQQKGFDVLKDYLEAALKDPVLLRTPPRIILEIYSAKLNTKVSTTGSSESTDANSSFSASAQTVYLISSLANKFAQLGLNDERRQSIALLKGVKPSTLSNDERASKLWSEQLVTLADEYREANNYLEAGRLYAFAGSEAEQWEGKTESLFKGGLLLYRAGRRDEAIEAFRKASQDQGNRYYAEMAKERLDKLTQ